MQSDPFLTENIDFGGVRESYNPLPQASFPLHHTYKFWGINAATKKPQQPTTKNTKQPPNKQKNKHNQNHKQKNNTQTEFVHSYMHTCGMVHLCMCYCCVFIGEMF